MNVFIIGGGAAGMMCAIIAARNGATVTLFDKNEKTGKKLYITGKGRCNLTNCTDFNCYMNNIISNSKFLYSSLKEFDNKTTFDFFTGLGLPLKIERGNRVFPESDKSSDVIKVMNNELKRLNVSVKLNEAVKDIKIINNIVKKIITDKDEYIVDKIVICTGGLSYPSTGSTGDGYIFAQKAGHEIINPVPSLCGIKLRNAIDANGNEISINNLPKIQGLSLKNVAPKIVNKASGKIIFEEFGEMIFTENGVSGPTILTLSSKINRLDLSKYNLIIDLKPALTIEKLNERLLRDFELNKNKMLKNSLSELLPASLINFVIALSGISPEKKINSIEKEDRKKLIKAIKGIEFSGLTLEDISNAIITSGGVNTKEINPKTMQSKLVENLYFAGEVIDVDALTGGFNLQIAFSTGYVAGKHLSD